MRNCVCLIAFMAVSSGQPRPTQVEVAAGTQKEIVIHAPAAHEGDMIDVLPGNPRAAITVVLPDGREVTSGNAEETGLALVVAVEEIVNRAAPSVRKFLVPGAGPHVVVILVKKPVSGDYRIRVDGRKAIAPFRAAAAYVPWADRIMDALRALPGAQISQTIKIPARSADTRITFPLTRAEGDHLIDVAVTDPRAEVTLQYPDGKVVTKANAKANGVNWETAKWPPPYDDIDPYDALFAAMYEPFMMLPIEGTHYQIGLNGIPASGSYTIRLNASATEGSSEVTAIFVPIQSVESAVNKEMRNLVNPSGTSIIGYDPDNQYYVGDKYDLAIKIDGEPLREPIQFTSRVTFTPAGIETAAKPVAVQIEFTRGADGRYHGSFMPGEAGKYKIDTTVKGSQASGRQVSRELSFSFTPHAVIARLTNITDRAVDTGGNGRPDRLDITAHLDVVVAGEYQFEAHLQASGGPNTLSESAKATLAKGPQEITISFGSAEVYERLPNDGPYTLWGVNLRLVRDPTLKVDVRKVEQHKTGLYRRDEWERGGFRGAGHLAGAGVDLKGGGRFQIYRVRWDVVTPGGDCSWNGRLSSGQAQEMANRRAHLAAGLATLALDFDGRLIAMADSPHAWTADILNVTCDGKPMSTTKSVLMSMDTGVLNPQDFEAVTPDFLAEPEAVELKLQAGGVYRGMGVWVHPVGHFSDPVHFELSGVPPSVRTKVTDVGGNWVGLRSGGISFYAREAAPSGDYPIRVIATAASIQHEFTFRLLIESPPPVPPALQALPEEGRRSVMLVAGTNANMFGVDRCETMKSVVRGLPDHLKSGRDALGIIEFADSVNLAMPLTTSFDAVLAGVLENLDRVQCGFPASGARALEKAREQLAREEFRGTDRIVVLVASGLPTAIAAEWPVRTQRDSRRIDGKEVILPPSGCSDNQGRHHPEPSWATGDSMPDRPGALGVLNLDGHVLSRFLTGPLAPPDLEMQQPRFSASDPKAACSLTAARAPSDVIRDIAYLPETDLNGIPLDGKRRLVRFEAGPYKGHIRPDSKENQGDALQNLFDNTMQRLRDDGIRVFVVRINPFRELGAVELGPDLAFTVHDIEQVPAALNRIWVAIGR
jgi:hypothetical protein